VLASIEIRTEMLGYCFSRFVGAVDREAVGASRDDSEERVRQERLEMLPDGDGLMGSLSPPDYARSADSTL
jgi:hypothetical protein